MFLRRGKRQKCVLSPRLFNIVLEVLAKAIGHKNEIKKTPRMEKKRSETIHRTHDLYTDNPKEFTKSLFELINEFSKVAGYTHKIKTQN